MSTLKIALIQSQLHWHQPDANRAMFEEKLWGIPEEVDLVVLPEMFTTGFTMAAQEMAEPVNFKTAKWLSQMAQQSDCAITGSFIVKEKEAYYNRLHWVEPGKPAEIYDKRHLFRFAEEHHTFDAGTNQMIVDYKGWKIMPQVCYDLRFPVWTKNTYSDEGGFRYDLLIFVANWPKARVRAWDSLLQARAIENSSYVIGVNRVGTDGKNIDYNGHSSVFDPKGNRLTFLGEEDEIQTVVIDLEELNAYREKFQVHLDWDDFEIRL